MNNMKYKLLTITAMFAAASWTFSGCGGDDSEGLRDSGAPAPDSAFDSGTGGSGGSGTGGTGGDAATAADCGCADSAPRADTGVPEPDSGSETNPSGKKNFGFSVREPAAHTLQCTIPNSTETAENEIADTDWICTFVHGAVSGYIYLADTPISCTTFGMSPTAKFNSQGYISIDGKVDQLSGATYLGGGNHPNDSLEFDYAGAHYNYYHSSIGFGDRACQPMDCMQVYASAGGALTEDGCTSDRTLPIVCLRVEAGKSYVPADFADTFACCPGDETCQ